jgi:hypothetical protein
LSSRGEAVAIQEKVGLDCFVNTRNDIITHKEDQIFYFFNLAMKTELFEVVNKDNTVIRGIVSLPNN